MYESNQLKAVRNLLNDLDAKKLRPNPLIYWFDFLLSYLLFITCFITVVSSENGILALTAFGVGVVLCFRLSTFVHEINHSAAQIRGFRRVYDLLFGYPFKMQTALFRNHVLHHNVGTFGTERDPKYDDFNKQGLSRILRVIPDSILYALKMNLRALIPIRQMQFDIHSTVNPKYKSAEKSSPDLLESLFLWVVLTLCFMDVFSWSVFIILNCFVVAIWIFDFIHLIGAHGYSGFKKGFGLQDQVVDSHTLVGPWYSEVWNPLGLRFHALHHLRPDIPYHAMSWVHEYLVQRLPEDHFYLSTIRKSAAMLWWNYLGNAFKNSKSGVGH